MKRLLAAAGAAIICATGAFAGQAQPPASPPPRPQFRSSVDTIPLDVSVLDRDRRPVRGLTPADFTLLEDGKPQEITVFQAVDIPEATPLSAPWMREVARDVVTNDGLQERRLFLIVMDDATIQADGQALSRARDIAHKVIDRLGPSDLAAVLFTRDGRNSQDYTIDRRRLGAAVDKFSVGFRDMGLLDPSTGRLIPGEDKYYELGSVGVLDNAVELLSSLPDRRKTMVYIGQGVPTALDDNTPAAAGLPSGGGSSAIENQGTAATARGLMTRLFQRAQRANVNVYTLDACGLRGPAGLMGAGNRAPTCVSGGEVDFLLALAANTGGRAVVNTSDVDAGVTAIFEENASYYLLGFRPLERKDGTLHRLQVRVNRPGVDVRTRSGYLNEKTADAAKRSAAAAAAPVSAALAGVLPKSDLPLQVSAVALPVPGKRESTVAVMVGVRQPIRPAAGPVVEHVDLQVSAFDVYGKAFDSKRLQADVTIRSGATGLAEYEVLSKIELGPGRYQLRVAANVGSLATSGSVYCDVDVPDVSKAPVSLSGMFFTADPGLAVSPANALQPLLKLVPTTRRAFASSDKVGAFARMYQAGKAPLRAVPLRLRLFDQTGTAVMDRRQDVEVGRFTPARSAEILVEVPVARLAAGEYLLTLEAELGKVTARRDGRFRVGNR